MEVQKIPLSLVFPSPMNPRKTFDEVELAELADNIEKQGLLQPITVRPVKHPNNEFKDRPDKYEIVCGERRYRAIKELSEKYRQSEGLNKFDFILAIVREMNDDEAFEAMITENLQRKDVDPMEEAFAFGKLIDKGNTVEEIASRFGKSVRFIQDRVKLNNLIPELMSEVRNGQMPIVAAQMISKLAESDQSKYYEENKKYYGFTKQTAKNFIDVMFMKITDAIWYKEAPDFSDGCGVKCSECHFNTANHGCLFYEMKNTDEGKCTDRDRFKTKSEAFILHLVDSNSHILVKDDEDFVYGKTVVGISLASYEYDTVKKYKEHIRQIIADKGYKVINVEDALGSRCWYEPDDERLTNLLQNGDVYPVLDLFQYQALKPEIKYYYTKKGHKSSIQSMLPPKVAKMVETIKSDTKGLESTITCECAKTLHEKSQFGNEPLAEIEKKAFVTLMLTNNLKIRNAYGIGTIGDAMMEKRIKENLNIFHQCVRAYLQEQISATTPNINHLKPMFADLAELWCADEYKSTIDTIKAKHDKKMAKLAKQLEAEGYDTEGNKLTKADEVQKEEVPKSSNLLEQYVAMKKKHPDAILLFRVGDFYEALKEDAEQIFTVLGLTLTKRGGKDGYYLTGFPHHALDTYLPKIIQLGRRVAICEQLEDPEGVNVSS